MKRITLPALAFILAFFLCPKDYGQIITTVAGNGTMGYSGDGGPATAAAFNGALSVACDNSGNIYIADYLNCRIRKINSAGIITTLAGIGIGGYSGDGVPATTVHISRPPDVAVNKLTGDVYICDSQRIRKINSSGIISTVAGTGILGFSGDGGPATLARLGFPQALEIDSSGNLYIADTYNDRVRKVNSSGIINTIAGSVSGYGGDGGAATAAKMLRPYDVAFDHSGNIYVADLGNSIVRKINSAGVITTVAGTPSAFGYSGDGGPATNAQLNDPYSIAIDTMGNLYIADTRNQVIRKVTVSGIITTYAGTGVAGYFGDGGPATSAKIYNPGGMCSKNGSALYFADCQNNRIRKITYPSVPCTPTVSISVSPSDTVCPGIRAVFTATATDTGTATIYRWYVNGVGTGIHPVTTSYIPSNGDIVFCSIVTSGGPCGGSDTAFSNTIVMTVTSVTPTIAGSHVVNLCSGAPTLLLASPPGGTWSSDNTSIAAVGSGGTVTGISVGITTITYTSSYGCFTTWQVTVNAIVPRITNNRRMCEGDTLTLHNVVSGGVWASDSPAVATIDNSGLVTGLTVGTSVISYSFGAACVATDTVRVYPVPVISGISNICLGDTAFLTTTVAGGLWQSTVTGVATVSNGTVSGVSPGTAIIVYSTSANCVAIHPVTVSVKPNAGTISGQDELCPGEVTTLSETVAGGSWSSSHTYVATVDSATGKVTGIGTGSTVIIYTVAPNGGCSSRAIFTIVVSSGLLTMGYNVKDPKCYASDDGSISVMVAGGKGPYSYSWSNGLADAVISNLAAGTYVVNIKDSGTQCTLSGTFHLVAPDSPQVATEVRKDACNNSVGSIAVIASGGTSPYHYQWSNGDTTSEINRLSAGNYTLTFTDGNGCIKNLSFTVQDTACAAVVVHDAISPNGDGINDVWVIEDISNFPLATVQLFDKWGSRVYEKTGYNNDWQGGTLPDGTYYYLVKLNAPATYVGKSAFTGTLLIKR